MRRSRAYKKGKNFVAAGWGRYGPYAVATRRIRGCVYAKASIGTKGPHVGVKYSGRRISVQGMINLITRKPSFSMKRKPSRRKR